MDIKGIGTESREVRCFYIGHNDFTGVKVRVSKGHDKGNAHGRLGSGSAGRCNSFTAVEERSAISNDSRLVRLRTFLGTLLGVNKIGGHSRVVVLGIYFCDRDLLVHIIVDAPTTGVGWGGGGKMAAAAAKENSCRSLEGCKLDAGMVKVMVEDGRANREWGRLGRGAMGGLKEVTQGIDGRTGWLGTPA
uniref:Uncharacterized protein n=1 Tax=Chromera velia CCMP2878 TaxID=1169474 RepID=A0A0G4GU12_9ALVE|eukprot:Cvel_752.t1-p1 / transcript=Cvel_752.t1 / gene=Cvel_752 / organism=Chromera_velia_CCMP2878 / gene_product=hypothetical protein / transcript_product=hypothetical protein / location=Cvel_scaffold23:98666-100029(+) / protein_length=189 / sequence_SO=supercontig / SO=protein_coding / is_pseudo=false